MTDRTCIKCNTTFQYLSYYKRHLKTSSRCKIENQDTIIETPINIPLNLTSLQIPVPPVLQESVTIVEIQFCCESCSKVFTRKSSLIRHKKETKCGNIQQQINNQIQNITNNNDNRTININNNNNITINNIVLPQFINPFGCESIDFLNDSEMVQILKSPNGAIIAMEKVYSKIENRNFYKQNLGKDNISYLDSNLDIQVFKEKEFHDKLLFQSVEFMYRICFRCRERLSLEDQIVIMKNINIIEKTLEMKNDVANLVSAMLERDFMNVYRRDLILKFNKKLQNDESFKHDKLKFLKEIRKELNSYYINKTNVTISDDILKEEAWMKAEAQEPNVKQDEICNNLNMYYINDTPRYKFFEKMKEDELIYMKEHGFTIADVKELIKIHTNRTTQELDYIKETYNIERTANISETLKNIEEEAIKTNLVNISLNNNLLETY